MAKTTEQLLQQAVQIRDEQANKKNTALRVGTLFSDIIEKQEESDQTHATDVTKINEAVTENREKVAELNSKILYIPQVNDVTDKSYEYDIVLQPDKTYFVKLISGDIGNIYTVAGEGSDEVYLKLNQWVEFIPKTNSKPRTYVANKVSSPSVVFADKDGVINELNNLQQQIDNSFSELNNTKQQIDNIIYDVDNIKEAVYKKEITDIITTYYSGYINKLGTVTESTYAKHSDFVEFDDNIDYYIKSIPSDSWYIGYYSSNDESSFISTQKLGTTSSDLATIKLQKPNNARYVRVSVANRTTSEFYSIKYIGFINVGEELNNLQQQIDNIKNDVNPIIDSLTDSKEELINTTFNAGYINKLGTVTESTYAKYSDFVELEKDVDYYIDTVISDSWYIGYYSSNDESSFISTQKLGTTSQDVQILKLIRPENANYVRVSLSVRESSRFYNIVNIGLINAAEEFKGINQRLDVVEKEINKIYIVGQNGDYATIHEAFSALKDNENPKIIYIDGGEYDVYEEMGGADFVASIPEEVTEIDWPLYSNYIPHNTKVIGLGQVNISFLPDDDIPQAKKGVICPMAFRGAVELENISITAANCRYCIHDEAGAGVENEKYHGIIKAFRNVHLYNKGGGYTQAYGAGHQANNTIKFDSCTFKSVSVPWSTHDNTSSNDNTTITIDNSAFISENNSNSIELKNLNGKSGYKNVTITNSVVKKLHIQDSESLPNHYKVKLIRCGNVEISSVTANGKDLVEIVE